MTCAPMGGFYLFPDFSAWKNRLAQHGVTTDTQLCERLLLEAGVALLPGSAFGYPANNLSVRLSYVTFDGVSALDDRIPVTVIATPVMVAIEAIIEWLNTLPQI